MADGLLGKFFVKYIPDLSVLKKKMKKLPILISIFTLLLTSYFFYTLRAASGQRPAASGQRPAHYAVFNFPATHENILAEHTWNNPVRHTEDDITSCSNPAASSHSQCIVTIQIPDELLKQGASHMLLRAKAKAWVPNGEDTHIKNASLIYASLVNPTPSNIHLNHFIHCETFGGGADYQGETRRVTFSTLVVPIFDGKIKVRVGKEIIGRGLVEIAFYNDGFFINH